MPTLHASCVSIEGRGVLLLGESGAGKSDLALRLIDRGAVLVADDYVEIDAAGDRLLASPPQRIAGMIEARGIGFFTLPCARDVPLALAVRLVAREAIERLPEPQFFSCLGLQVPLVSLHAHDHSTEAKIRFALAQRG